MQLNGIDPKEVLNVDPFVSNPKSGADIVVHASATNELLPDILSERGFKKFDEIWAVYSVPAYLENPDDIKRLFKNIDELLAENGNARIWPLEIRGGSVAEVTARKLALMEAVNELNATGRYEISEVNTKGVGITLHKVKK